MVGVYPQEARLENAFSLEKGSLRRGLAGRDGPVDLLPVEPDDHPVSDEQRGCCQRAPPPQLVDRARRLADVDLLELPSLARQILCRLVAGRSPGLRVDLDHRWEYNPAAVSCKADFTGGRGGGRTDR